MASCTYCQKETTHVIPVCWGNYMAFGTKVDAGLCWKCAKPKWALWTDDEAKTGNWYLMNKSSLNMKFGYKEDIPKEAEQHSWKLGMKGTYYLVRVSEANIEFDTKRKNGEAGKFKVEIEFCCAVGKCKCTIRKSKKKQPY